MRIVHALVCLVLILFVGVQYNDPDYHFWMPVYGIPAVLAGVAAWAPARLRLTPVRLAIAVCTVLALAGTVWFWPTEKGFWHQEIWWASETAREGMGMMVVTIALLLLAASAFLGKHGGTARQAGE